MNDIFQRNHEEETNLYFHLFCNASVIHPKILPLAFMSLKVSDSSHSPLATLFSLFSFTLSKLASQDSLFIYLFFSLNIFSLINILLLTRYHLCDNKSERSVHSSFLSSRPKYPITSQIYSVTQSIHLKLDVTKRIFLLYFQTCSSS